MSIRVVILIVSFCLGLSGALVGNLLFVAMIGEVNRKRRDGDTLSYFGFDFPKLDLVLREYRSAYPRGKLHTYFGLACAVMLIGFFGCGVALFILR